MTSKKAGHERSVQHLLGFECIDDITAINTLLPCFRRFATHGTPTDRVGALASHDPPTPPCVGEWAREQIRTHPPPMPITKLTVRLVAEMDLLGR